jgi:hypothetical protein
MGDHKGLKIFSKEGKIVVLYLSNVVLHLCNGRLIFEFLPFLVGHIEDWE